MLRLEFLNRPLRPHWLAEKSISVGRGEGSQLMVDDPSVSPQHARILTQGKAVSVIDLGSEQGTYVNGHRVQQRQIDDGDTLRFGDVEVKITDPYSHDGANRPWILVGSSSWLSGQEFPVSSKSANSIIKVGRGKHCDIILPGTHLSREHAELEVRGDMLLVRDLSSANGTYINDERITEAYASAGDKLRFDVYSFKVIGPRARHDNETGSTPALHHESTVKNPETNIEEPKLWQTRPTSPGNRVEATQDSSSQLWLYLLAGALMITAVGIALYIFLG